MERANLFKRKKIAFVSKEARLGRALEVQQERNDKRAQQFNQVRAVPDVQEDVGDAGCNLDRRKRLELWKAQKNIKKKLEATKKKPAFVVGVTRHKIYSPKSADPPMQHCHGKKNPPKKPSPVKKITRATAKRLAAKAKGELVPKSPLAPKSPGPTSKIKTPGPASKIKTPGPVNKTKTSGKAVGTPLSRKFKFIAPDNYVFKPPPSIEPIPLQTECFTKKDLSSRISKLIATSFKSTESEISKNFGDGLLVNDKIKKSEDFSLMTKFDGIDSQNKLQGDGFKLKDLPADVEPKILKARNQSQFVKGNIDEKFDVTKDLEKSENIYQEVDAKVSKSPARKSKTPRSRSLTINQTESESDKSQFSKPEIIETKNQNNGETLIKDLEKSEDISKEESDQVSISPAKKSKLSRGNRRCKIINNQAESESEDLQENKPEINDTKIQSQVMNEVDTIDTPKDAEKSEDKFSKSPAKKVKLSRQGRRPKTINDEIEPESDQSQLSEPEITTPKSEADDEKGIPFLAALSPYIVMGRGNRGRKEQRDRLLNNSFGGEIPTKDTVQMLNTSGEDNIKTAKYYKHLLEKETSKLQALCDEWKKIRDENQGEEGYFIIQQAIGQSELLIKKKFGRFSRLVDDCESNNQELLVKSDDLRGFWEMMEPEIKNCYDRFANVEKLKEKNWVEDEEELPVVEVKKKGKKVVKPKAQGKSNMKAFIEAARKKKLQAEASADKTPEGRVLRSRAVKTPEVQLDSSISYINSHQTPGKSILKKKKTEVKDLNKSLTKVNFSICQENTDVGEIVQKVANQEADKPSKAAKMLIQKLFGNTTGGLSNVSRVNVRAAKAQIKKEKENQHESPVKTPKRKSGHKLAEKENATTPSRRSSRRSMRLNISDECTAC
ncbi:uncharacterized protein LOC123270219 [Cotesia glomerata]|uniref:Disks large-associated protein 5 n=1 Tax=Cotesia glomerata TaxID=32391 RepID=A0AAV7IG86_COTGL|nr:uncharacterized protein LOC123270219 [Cotesia glomerata]KAH0552244.1 hypothetical protein KQX54_007626 [Cotesia glomerata]